MAILQVYQADLLNDLDSNEATDPESVREIRRATYLALRATKQTARSIGYAMAAMVATEWDLWLNLSGIREKESLSPGSLLQLGLFGGAVSAVADRFQPAKKQSAAFRQFLPF